MAKRTISLTEDLYAEISEYCKLNGLNVSFFCEKLLKDGFMKEKYGDIPFGTFTTTKIIPSAIENFNQEIVHKEPVIEPEIITTYHEETKLNVESDNKEITNNKPQNKRRRLGK